MSCRKRKTVPFFTFTLTDSTFRLIFLYMLTAANKNVKLQLLFSMGVKDVQTLMANTRISRASAYRKIAALKKNIKLERKKGRISTADHKSIVQTARKNATESSSVISNKLSKRRKVNVSARTVQRYLKKSGYQKKLPKKSPNLTKEQMEKRVTFCREMSGYSFENVFITDECCFYLHRNTLKHWCKANKRLYKKMPKFSPSIMVWGLSLQKGFIYQLFLGM